jgi:hypothetical protein
LITINSVFCQEDSNQKGIETGIVLDSLQNSVQLYYTDQNHPSYYKSTVFTPVCAVGECLPIRINLFWTLAGSYLKYTLPENEILTKTDHVHFTKEDYQKLDGILRNRNSTLLRLMNEPRKVDGTTGPTVLASRHDYVDSAIYTSLTLYSIVYGPAKDEIRLFTKKNLIQTENILTFLDHSDGELVELGYEWFSEKRSETELTEFILQRFDSGSEQRGDIAIKYLDKKTLCDTFIQNRLCSIYLSNNTKATTRLHLLETWRFEQLTSTVQATLVNGFMKFKSDFELILLILDNQKIWSLEVYNLLSTAITEENNMTRKKALFMLLEKRIKTAPKEVKSFLKKVKKENAW